MCVAVRLGVRAAIPLSHATIAAGSLAAIILALPKKHPLHPSRPLIDFQIVLLMMPSLLLGTMLGVFFHVMSPDWLLLLLLVIALSYSAWSSGKKAVKVWAEESSELAATEHGIKASNGDESQADTAPLMDAATGTGASTWAR